jgi:tetratricopeptide (TPR) repeat protein
MAGSGGQDVLSSTYSFLAKAYLGQNKVDEALESAERALRLAQEMESPDDLGIAWRALGRVLARTQKPFSIMIAGESKPRTVGAGDCFAESERIFKEIEREDELARTLSAWAQYKLAQGEYDHGMRMWRDAREIFLQLGAHSEVERMEEIHAS